MDIQETRSDRQKMPTSNDGQHGRKKIQKRLYGGRLINDAEAGKIVRELEVIKDNHYLLLSCINFSRKVDQKNKEEKLLVQE